MEKKLTIGMATYDDFDGVYFSTQAARFYHPEVFDDIEFIVIDNNPHGKHGKEVKKLINNHLRDSNNKPNGRYIPVNDRVSTAVRNETFTNSNTPYTLNIDCHVFVAPGSLKKLIDMYEENPTTNDFYQGPMIHDNLRNNMACTHMEPVWRSEMYGTWATDARGTGPDEEPFEIDMHGLGLFSCRTEAWPGFNKMFRGFGGEEGYIHKKFRKRGDKVWCLPWLRWMHRFNRPDGVKYVLTRENKVRNYFIGAIELDEEPDDIIEHFSEWMSEESLRRLYKNVKQEVEFANK
jgi:hypothetical protein